MPLIPIILAGGSGSRMQPISTPQKPKQFLDLSILGSDKAGPEASLSLLQKTMLRAQAVSDEAPIVISNQRYRELLKEQLLTERSEIEINSKSKILSKSHPKRQILLEPCKRNTAPAIALAAFKALQLADDPLLLVLPSDHQIKDLEGFKRSVDHGKQLARQGWIVAFGVKADHASSELGYIQRGQTIHTAPQTQKDCLLEQASAYRVQQFVEKPDIKTAQGYLQSADFYWNSGIYLLRAKLYLEQLSKYQALVLAACQQAYNKSVIEQDFLLVDHQAFNQCPTISIDYAIMEKTDKALVIPLACDWLDVGIN